mmetsp:Transcript_19032/g.63749  ORF Transcript_19032/g.63749 Transcript_19032/m.63749 type:complete len:346 (+) Transcript_19032:63-1100(+)
MIRRESPNGRPRCGRNGTLAWRPKTAREACPRHSSEAQSATVRLAMRAWRRLPCSAPRTPAPLAANPPPGEACTPAIRSRLHLDAQGEQSETPHKYRAAQADNLKARDGRDGDAVLGRAALHAQHKRLLHAPSPFVGPVGMVLVPCPGGGGLGHSVVHEEVVQRRVHGRRVAVRAALRLSEHRLGLVIWRSVRADAHAVQQGLGGAPEDEYGEDNHLHGDRDDLGPQAVLAGHLARERHRDGPTEARPPHHHLLAVPDGVRPHEVHHQGDGEHVEGARDEDGADGDEGEVEVHVVHVQHHGQAHEEEHDGVRDGCERRERVLDPQPRARREVGRGVSPHRDAAEE